MPRILIEQQAQRPSPLERLHAEIRACRACEVGGYLNKARPIRESGRGSGRVMVIGQAPGALSDAARQHFTGPAGKLLERWFVQAGFPEGYLRQEVYLTAVTRCYPGKSRYGKGDRTPSSAERALCRPFLERELATVKPSLVIPLGALAIERVLGDARLQEVVGRLYRQVGRDVLPLPHPSPVSRWLNDPENRALVNRGIGLLARWREQLSLS
jgi:uracil-DNA glycosylase